MRFLHFIIFVFSLLAFLVLSPVTYAQNTPVKIFTTRDGLAGDYVTAIAFARDGSAWIGTTEGATHIEPQRWTSYTRVHGLGDSWITSIAIAPDERVWYGTQSGGVSILDPQTKKITTYNLDNSDIPSNFITAIRADENNRIWIETLNQGTAIFDAAQNNWTRTTQTLPVPARAPDDWRATPRGLVVTNPPAWLNPPQPYPTVLIHGWTVSGDDTLETSEFHFLKNYADRDGIPMYYVRGVSPKNTLYQNAQIIRDEIARVKKETGADKVNIIGFSMGGMNTRAYLETSLYANDVNRAILLGSPQAGVEVWKPMLFQQILQKPDEPSTIELSPEYAQQIVNATRAPNPDVPYDALIGDASQQEHLKFFDNMRKSDALISVSSSLALDGANVRKHINADLHDWNPQAVPLEFTSYLYPRDTWERYLRNALRNNDNAPIGSEIVESRPLRFSETSKVLESNHTPVVTEKIRAGETVTRTVLVDENKSARFVAYYPGGKIDFSLVAPDGKTYEIETLPRDEDENVFSLATDVASFSGHLIKNAPVGKWQMILKRTDAGTKPIDVSTYVELDSLRALNASQDADAPNRLRAFVSPLASNVTMTARAAVPSETRGEPYRFVSLNVTAPDANGNVVADLPYDKPGWYPVFVTARGNNFERETEFLYQVPSRDAKIEPNARVMMQENSVTFEVTVNARQGGAYALSGSLTDAQNANAKPARTSVVPIKLRAGINTIALTFDTRTLAPGTYRLDTILLDADWAARYADGLQNVATFTR